MGSRDVVVVGAARDCPPHHSHHDDLADKRSHQSYDNVLAGSIAMWSGWIHLFHTNRAALGQFGYIAPGCAEWRPMATTALVVATPFGRVGRGGHPMFDSLGFAWGHYMSGGRDVGGGQCRDHLHFQYFVLVFVVGRVVFAFAFVVVHSHSQHHCDGVVEVGVVKIVVAGGCTA